jgi:hypothetical protein
MLPWPRLGTPSQIFFAGLVFSQLSVFLEPRFNLPFHSAAVRWRNPLSQLEVAKFDSTQAFRPGTFKGLLALDSVIYSRNEVLA